MANSYILIMKKILWWNRLWSNRAEGIVQMKIGADCRRTVDQRGKPIWRQHRLNTFLKNLFARLKILILIIFFFSIYQVEELGLAANVSSATVALPKSALFWLRILLLRSILPSPNLRRRSSSFSWFRLLELQPAAVLPSWSTGAAKDFLCLSWLRYKSSALLNSAPIPSRNCPTRARVCKLAALFCPRCLEF